MYDQAQWPKITVKLSMQPEKKVIFDLNEHDASQLLALIRREVHEDEKIWRPYWKRLAEIVELAIENAARSSALGYSSSFNDRSDGQ
jgi:hypothetical protein